MNFEKKTLIIIEWDLFHLIWYIPFLDLELKQHRNKTFKFFLLGLSQITFSQNKGNEKKDFERPQWAGFFTNCKSEKMRKISYY